MNTLSYKGDKSEEANAFLLSSYLAPTNPPPPPPIITADLSIFLTSS
jgi:hypothetical protein